MVDQAGRSSPLPPWPASWLRPQFSAPRVRAVMSSREGGVSLPPYAALNLAVHVGDDATAVAANRAVFARCLGAVPHRLNQVHGWDVARLDESPPQEVSADASVTLAAGVACEVQVADCLPVLLADRSGRAVAAAHAGWRGLAGSVLEASIDALCSAAGCPAGDLEAWLGPCIGPTRFEVGADVLLAMGVDPESPGAHFAPQNDAQLPIEKRRWLASLPGLARQRLGAAGLAQVSGNDGSDPWCTVLNPERFFSFRRDGRTGRQSAAIWLVD